MRKSKITNPSLQASDTIHLLSGGALQISLLQKPLILESPLTKIVEWTITRLLGVNVEDFFLKGYGKPKLYS